MLIYAGLDLPLYGDANAPIHNNVTKYYNQNTYNDLGITSFVAGILASYRGYDTLGETLVIFAAGICVLFIFSDTSSSKKSQFEDNIILRRSTKFITPFILLFAIYIQINGTSSPGGGFQAGTILASLIIAMDLSHNYKIEINHLINMSSAGIILYLMPGIFALIRGYNFLNYSALPFGQHSQKIGIETVELGICMSVFATLSIIYYTIYNNSSSS
ncbi:MAG UNVERIFIED_CONTAM: hypothetical protein LVQ98_08745 [Rickettsiaceae bacterium]|jgi:multicomponent Na+:H+ antiporter subunit B